MDTRFNQTKLKKDYENYRFKIIRLSNPRKKKRIKLYTSIFV